MKKILSTIVTALAALSFAGIVFAADVPTTEPTVAAPAAEVNRPAAKQVKKHHRHHKHHRQHRHHRHHRAVKVAGAPGAAPMAAPAPVPAPPAGQ